MSEISDDDSDYCDVAEPIVEDHSDNIRKETRVNKEGVKVRGKDLEWVEIDKFENEESYRKSEIKKKLFENLSRSKNRNVEYGLVENFVLNMQEKLVTSLVL